MKKVLLVNQGHTDNIGDQLISKIMYKQLSDFCDITISKFIPGERVSKINLTDSIIDDEIKINKLCDRLKKLKNNYNISLWFLTLKYYKRIMKVVNNRYDAILIGGGELLASYVVFIAAMQAWLLYGRKNKTKLIIYGVSGFPFEKRKHRFLKYLLNNCNLICVRDKATQTHLCSNLKNDVHYAPDIVFSLNYILNNIDDNNAFRNNMLVSVYSIEELGVLNDVSEYFDKWVHLIIDKITPDIEYLLVGYTTQSDYETAIQFYHYLIENSLLPDLKVKLCNYSDWEGYCDTVSKCRLVITGRMHAMIIALQLGCNVIPYVVKRKISVFKSEYIDTKYDMLSVNKKIQSSIDLIREKIDA